MTFPNWNDPEECDVVRAAEFLWMRRNRASSFSPPPSSETPNYSSWKDRRSCWLPMMCRFLCTLLMRRREGEGGPSQEQVCLFLSVMNKVSLIRSTLAQSQRSRLPALVLVISSLHLFLLKMTHNLHLYMSACICISTGIRWCILFMGFYAFWNVDSNWQTPLWGWTFVFSFHPLLHLLEAHKTSRINNNKQLWKMYVDIWHDLF